MVLMVLQFMSRCAAASTTFQRGLEILRPGQGVQPLRRPGRVSSLRDGLPRRGVRLGGPGWAQSIATPRIRSVDGDVRDARQVHLRGHARRGPRGRRARWTRRSTRRRDTLVEDPGELAVCTLPHGQPAARRKANFVASGSSSDARFKRRKPPRGRPEVGRRVVEPRR